MPKFKCCRQTFLNKILLAEHVITHPPNWGKPKPGNISQVDAHQHFKVSPVAVTPPTCLPLSFRLTSESPPLILTPPLTPIFTSSSQSPPHQPEILKSLLDPPQVSSSKKDQSNKRKRKRTDSITEVEVEVDTTEPEQDLYPNRDSWKEWDCALGTLFEERNKFSKSHTDAFYWDLAIDTIISLRNRYYCQNGNGEKPTLSQKGRSIIAVEEHNQVLKRIDEVRQERDALKVKWEESERRRRVLEQIEKQYKQMLSVRTEEVFRVRKMVSECSPEKSSLTFGAAALPGLLQSKIFSSVTTKSLDFKSANVYQSR